MSNQNLPETSVLELKEHIKTLETQLLNTQAELDTLRGIVTSVEIQRDAVLMTHKETMATIVQFCKFPQETQ